MLLCTYRPLPFMAIEFAVVIHAWRHMKNTHTNTGMWTNTNTSTCTKTHTNTHAGEHMEIRVHTSTSTCKHAYTALTLMKKRKKKSLPWIMHRGKHSLVLFIDFVSGNLLGPFNAYSYIVEVSQGKSRSNILSFSPSFQCIHSSGEQYAGMSLQNDKSLVLMQLSYSWSNQHLINHLNFLKLQYGEESVWAWYCEFACASCVVESIYL